MKHDHLFVRYLDHAVGYREKRDCPGDGWAIYGKVDVCLGCWEMRFQPEERRGWDAVRAELMSEDEVIEAKAQ